MDIKVRFGGEKNKEEGRGEKGGYKRERIKNK